LSGSEGKNRDDYRHHALDAMVIGITDQGLLKRFADANKQAEKKNLDRLLEEMPEPMRDDRGHYRVQVARALNAIIVSHKPDHGYQGAMHEESAWGPRADGQVQRRVRPEGGGPRELHTANKQLVWMTAPRHADRHGVLEDGSPKPYKGYVGGSNYCLEIWRDDKGRWKGDVVSTWQAYQIVHELGEATGFQRLRDPQWTQSGRPLLMRLMINDLVRMELDGQSHILRVASVKSNGQFLMADHNEANVDARNRDKANAFNYVSKYPGSFQASKGRRITVSPIGAIRDPGFPG